MLKLVLHLNRGNTRCEVFNYVGDPFASGLQPSEIRRNLATSIVDGLGPEDIGQIVGTLRDIANPSTEASYASVKRVVLRRDGQADQDILVERPRGLLPVLKKCASIWYRERSFAAAQKHIGTISLVIDDVIKDIIDHLWLRTLDTSAAPS